jgi:Flp pilus assembly protein CpaB
MRRSIADLLVLLNRWPRRLTAVACLLLAAGSALASRDGASAAAQGRDTVGVVVSARALPVGAMLGERDIRLTQWPHALAPANRIPDSTQIVGRRMAAAIGAGEAITANRLLGADLADGLPRGLVANAVSIDADVAAFVHPGDHVDLLTAPAADSGFPTAEAQPTSSAATVVAEDVAVLAVLPTNGSKADDARTQLVIASDRSTALHIAALQGRALLAVVANPP